MKDEIGNRMKTFYEDRTQSYLPRRTFTIIRVDGKAFHTYTRGLKKPFDMQLIKDMNETTKYLCENIQGCKFGYVQSDEISLLLTDFDTLKTDAWFDGKIQKIVSVSASMATMRFNQLRKKNNAMFDSRCFTIPYQTEVENYFIWRQQDCTRNSISSVAQSLYSPKKLNGKSTNVMQEMIFEKGINWNDYDEGLKRGRVVVKDDGVWKIINPPIFTQDREFIQKFFPIME